MRECSLDSPPLGVGSRRIAQVGAWCFDGADDARLASEDSVVTDGDMAIHAGLSGHDDVIADLGAAGDADLRAEEIVLADLDIMSQMAKVIDLGAATDDGVIHRTGNIFAEEMKYWKSGSISDGWMRNGKYDYLCVLDMIDHNLYILDFNRFKKMYRKGKFIKTNMGDNITTGYCVPLWRCREDKCLLYEIQYEYDEDFDFYSIKKAV